jgi:deazaflavin-dependent oxidoreductase (nitroreductase family)
LNYQHHAGRSGSQTEKGFYMDEKIAHALEVDRVIDITTIGRKSGKPRRIEIWFHNLDGQLYITGTPGVRDWYANLLAHPHFTFHLKQSLQADLPAFAVPVKAPLQRRAIMAKIISNLDSEADLDNWVDQSPLVEVRL